MRWRHFMDIRRSLKRARVGMVLPVLATTLGATAVATGVEGTTYIRAAAGIVDRALKPSSSIRATEFVLDSLPVIEQPDTAILAPAPAADSTPGSPKATLDVDSVRHPLVQQWVKKLATTSRHDYQSSLARMEKYEDMISS